MKNIFFVFITLLSITTHSQKLLPTPRNIQATYDKGTRSITGKPGKNYWQNKGVYSINITAMPPDRNIKGSEQITYTNNSNDTLRNPVIKLFLNIHKPGAPRDGGAALPSAAPGLCRARAWPARFGNRPCRGSHAPDGAHDRSDGGNALGGASFCAGIHVRPR